MLRRRWLSFLTVFLITTGVGVAVAAVHTEHYQAQAKLVFTPVLGRNLTFVPSQDSLQALIDSYADTAIGPAVVAQAERLLGRPLDGTPFSFTHAGDNSMTLGALSPSAGIAYQDAYALFRAFEQAQTGNTFFNVTVVSLPTLATAPVQPRAPLIIASAAGLGLVLGVLFAALVDYLRPRRAAKSDSDVELRAA
jgi:uncharacterized protein involved in exopolysaccharide biosynthesis